MTKRLFLVTIGAQAAGVLVWVATATGIGLRNPGIALIMGGIVGAQASAFVRRNESPLSAPVSMQVGLVVVATSVLAGSLMRSWGDVAVREEIILICGLGTFLFPVLMTGPLVQRFSALRRRA